MKHKDLIAALTSYAAIRYTWFLLGKWAAQDKVVRFSDHTKD